MMQPIFLHHFFVLIYLNFKTMVMKKYFLLLVLCLSYFGMAQNQNEADDNMPKLIERKNELRLSALYMVLGAVDLSYERFVGEETSVGINLFKSFDDYLEIDYQVIANFRYYFGKKPHAGFFAELYGNLNRVEEWEFISNTVVVDGNTFFNFIERPVMVTDFALGFGLGGKWITKKGLVFEVNGGIARNLFVNDRENLNRNFEIIGRIGVSIGYRF